MFQQQITQAQLLYVNRPHSLRAVVFLLVFIAVVIILYRTNTFVKHNFIVAEIIFILTTYQSFLIMKSNSAQGGAIQCLLLEIELKR